MCRWGYANQCRTSWQSEPRSLPSRWRLSWYMASARKRASLRSLYAKSLLCSVYEVRFVIIYRIFLKSSLSSAAAAAEPAQADYSSAGTKLWPQFKVDLAPISGTTGGPRRQPTPKLEWAISSGCWSCTGTLLPRPMIIMMLLVIWKPRVQLRVHKSICTVLCAHVPQSRADRGADRRADRRADQHPDRPVRRGVRPGPSAFPHLE